MSNTEQKQAEAMKRYIRKVFIPEYANNFNKELSASDIKFYGKIHFDRNRSDNELNMHCHLIVNRKDQSNKTKMSPLTNHRNTKKASLQVVSTVMPYLKMSKRVLINYSATIGSYPKRSSIAIQ